MKPFGGFDHNAQSLRVVTVLENRYAQFDGLNLTWEALEGLAKHNGPLHKPPPGIADYDQRHKLDLGTHASAEAQVAAMADDVAYHSHDLDDGLRAKLFTIEDLSHLPLVGEAVAQARVASLDVPPPRLRHETIRRVIDAMVNDLIAETRARLAKLEPADSDGVRRSKRPVVAFGARNERAPPGDQGFSDLADVQALAGEPHVGQGAGADRGAVPPARPRHQPCCATTGGRGRGEGGTQRAAATVCDYIAGMTDRYAMDEHRRLTDLSIPG